MLLYNADIYRELWCGATVVFCSEKGCAHWCGSYVHFAVTLISYYLDVISYRYIYTPPQNTLWLCFVSDRCVERWVVYAFLCYELTMRIIRLWECARRMLEENVYLLAFIIEFPVLLSFGKRCAIACSCWYTNTGINSSKQSIEWSCQPTSPILEIVTILNLNLELITKSFGLFSKILFEFSNFLFWK